ncbi:hypothetical protein CBD41_05275 [bacterium TMED181]|nr:MAG: hypothetical protein CBD41_05275 [bacterium TMED181]
MIVTSLILLSQLLVNPASAAEPLEDWRVETRAGLEKAVQFLLDHQEEDGAFGHWRNPLSPDDKNWMVPEQHFAFQVAITGICCVTLMDLGSDLPDGGEQALERALDNICENGRRKRIANWDTDNLWGYVYVLEAVARALAEPELRFGPERRARLRKLGEDLIVTLGNYQSPDGGWAYYDNSPFTRRPTWGTSFVTASLLLIFEQCEQIGLEVPDKMQERGLRALRRTRLPNGAYDYNIDPIQTTRNLLSINQIKGSLCRIQVGNLALRRLGDPDEITNENIVTGLDQLMRHHKFISLSRGRIYPHEAYYANSGYFFFYGHYYAADVIRQLPWDLREQWWPRLCQKILETQEEDGSMWDYAFFSYHRVYGTAWSISVLAKALADHENLRVPAKGKPNGFSGQESEKESREEPVETPREPQKLR